LVAGHRAPFAPPRELEPEPHIDSTRPGELVGLDCFFVGRLHGTKGPVWQITAIDTYSSFAWPDLTAGRDELRTPTRTPAPCSAGAVGAAFGKNCRIAGFSAAEMSRGGRI
jgi:hypothetical protein